MQIISKNKKSILLNIVISFIPAIFFVFVTDMSKYGFSFLKEAYFYYSGMFGVVADYILRNSYFTYTVNTLIRIFILFCFIFWSIKKPSKKVYVVNIIISLIIALISYILMKSTSV